MTDDAIPSDLEKYAEFRVDLDRAGSRAGDHPTRDDVRVLTPEFYEDFHEITTWMRANAPVYWDDAAGLWAVATHADVTRISRDWHTFCSGKGSRPDSNTPMMINFDAPEHTRRRRILSPGFSLVRVAEHEPFLRRTVAKLIDGVIERGECDIVRDIATPLPMAMIGELMGLPETDHEQLLHWSDLFATGGAEIALEVGQAVLEWDAYIRDVVARRRGVDGRDLISLIVNDTGGDPLTDTEIMFETMLVLVGGDETTRHVVSGGVEALLRHPAELDRLRADPSLMSSAIEEMLRWVTPVTNMNRTATRDVEVHGQLIREGDRMLLLYPSANRDEDVFADPFRFDVGRTPNDHVAFGAYGRHHCMGAPLARLELRVLFEELLARIPDLQLAGETRRRRGTFVLGFESVPVTFTPGRRTDPS